MTLPHATHRSSPTCSVSRAITPLIVTEHARGPRVGWALVEEAARRLAAKGCALIEVTSNQNRTPAHAFYERLGYVKTSYRSQKSLWSETALCNAT